MDRLHLRLDLEGYQISDRRLTLQYQWVSQSEPLYGKRPRFETYDTDVKSVREKLITLWKSVPVVEQQSVLAGERTVDPAPMRPWSGFAGSMITAGSLRIRSGSDVTVRAITETGAGDISIASGGSVLIAGQTASDAVNPQTLKAVAELRSVGNITINAAATLELDPDSLVQTVAETGTVALTSGRGHDA
ncbi:MAG UNVERIFIED_CONTAM: hypothetical protein LVR18_45785 [Planctomycetaceae bacterium]